MSSDRRHVLPILPLRGTVVFPGVTIPLAVGRASSLRAVDEALKGDRKVFAVTEREGAEETAPDRLYSLGVIAHVGEVQRGLGGIQLLLTPEQRATLLDLHTDGKGVTQATVRRVDQMRPLSPEDPAFLALYQEVRDRAVDFGKQKGLSEDVLVQVVNAARTPGDFADLVATYLEINTYDKQILLETLDVEDRLRKILVHLQRRLALLREQQKIRDSVNEEIGGRQREMYLREQLKAIHRELGEDDGNDVAELREKLERLELPEEARVEAKRQLARLERLGAESMEAQVIRTHLEWMAELPWNVRSEEQHDLRYAEEVLDDDHYGLKDVKDRVLEFLSVRDLRARDAEPGSVQQQKGSILLFVGPPGVGKTSIAKSIAKALGRKYVRIALGGARDDADIRGHRRTYVGAMPGRIISGLKQAGTKNPVFLLDEIDKLGMSLQGDPASALLEVLDPAQNTQFTDHYLNVPFDLSEVLFVATANVAHTIPPALLDRMDVVEFSGYTEREKLQIGKRYILPRQLEESGLAKRVPRLTFDDAALQTLITEYTRESGVRQLEREIANVTRKLARKLAAGQPIEDRVTASMIKDLLGRPRVHPEHASEVDEAGFATGLYYTPAGGDIMFVEAAIRRREGSRRPETIEAEGWGDVSLILTGQLGDVMKESARAALTYAATHARGLHIPQRNLGSIEAHIHVPAGAIPKDGPSAGVTIATALVSALTGRLVRKDVAMTGEITLRGRVLPIGGVKEKVLGAHRAGIRAIILPSKNRADLEDVPSDVRAELEFHFAETLNDVLSVALVPEGPAEQAAEPSDDGSQLQAPSLWISH